MKRQWHIEELEEHFTLLPPEIDLLGRDAAHNQLGKAILLKYFQHEGCFPEKAQKIPNDVIQYIAHQLNIEASELAHYNWKVGRIKAHRRDIREWMGFRSATIADQKALRIWLKEKVLPEEHRVGHLEQLIRQHLRQLHLEPPTPGRIQRIILTALRQYEKAFVNKTATQLTEKTKEKMAHLIQPMPNATEEKSANKITRSIPLHRLKAGVGDAKVKHIKEAAERLKILQDISLPADLFADIPLAYLRQYQQQVGVDSINRLQARRDNPRQTAKYYTQMAAFCWLRQRELTDQMVELFTQILNDIQLRAKKRVERELLADFIRVNGKQQLLFRLAEAMLSNPKGIIEDVLYPIVGKPRLEALVQEAKTNGTYQQTVQTRISASYTHHYRQILPPMLEVLTFRSNNKQYQPIIDALDIVIAYLNEKEPLYPAEEEIILDKVVPEQWHHWLYETDRKGRRRVRRVRYELCVLQALREKIRCKEIWIEGADRYRNPDEDVPADFEEKREAYYQALGLPLQADDFIKIIKAKHRQALQDLNDNLPTNKQVEILSKQGGRIRLSPLVAQAGTVNLRRLKYDIRRRWWLTTLLDVLKEADLQIAFTDDFHSLTGQERLSRQELRRRLLLCLFGLGTNTGLSSVSMGNHGIDLTKLQYIRRRYIAKDALRQAISKVTNATLAIRQPEIWGETATWCASDSKQFGAWNQNLLAQWHKRYRQSGVMIYWHVSKKSLCIYSQLKAPSSSEVAYMIEGVLRHCTAMQVDRNYVDTHGQSEVAFAFCHLLGFQLMPRLKDLYKQKLSVPSKEDLTNYPNLQYILEKVIDWELIARQYDEMVKYATALRLGTAEAEAILRRFTRNNLQHPTYKALSELGRVLKTIFLCRYLSDESVRREIQEGLNVIENWNSANGFIMYGRQGELTSNNIDSQEITMLSMHLLQSCLVYVNTLMVQEVLSEPKWFERMTETDWRGLSPLFYAHINPYGIFELDMEKRIPLSGQVTA